MTRPFLKKYTYDISLNDGAGAHLISWDTGLMVFFITLALAANFGLSSVTKGWTSGLSGTLTLELHPPAASEGGKISPIAQRTFDDNVKRVLSVLKKHPGISEARILPEAEIKNLIGSWMGQGISLDSIPLPTLIDIRMSEKGNAEQLLKDIKTIEPAATVDTHAETLDDVRTLVNTVTLFVYLLTGVIVFLAVIVIAGIVRSKLQIHQAEIKTLHLIGASDEYIARQFRQHALQSTMKGASIGLACTVITLLAIGGVTRTLNTDILSHLNLFPLQWILLILSPLAASSMIAHLTAQATVLKELSKLP